MKAVMSGVTVLRRGLLATLLLALPALAQDWPTRPVRMILPFAAGGAIDSASRALQPRLSEILGQPVVMENRTGAGGSIAAGVVAASAPDGYTLLMDATSHMLNPWLVRNLPFDYGRDLVPVTQFVIFPHVIAVKDALPVRTIEELVALARANPDTLTYGSPGNGTAGHIAGEFFRRCQTIQITHVPYRGGADAARDLAGGVIDIGSTTYLSMRSQLESGRARPLAMMSAQRLPALPNVPTLNESLCPGVVVDEWAGIFLRAGTPTAIVARVHGALAQALADQALRDRLLAIGAIPVGSSTADFTKLVRDGTESWGRVVREAGIRAE
jgi:tripartite-type tricarboxylate transporter receptor subunit TctC